MARLGERHGIVRTGFESIQCPTDLPVAQACEPSGSMLAAFITDRRASAWLFINGHDRQKDSAARRARVEDVSLPPPQPHRNRTATAPQPHRNRTATAPHRTAASRLPSLNGRAGTGNRSAPARPSPSRSVSRPPGAHRSAPTASDRLYLASSLRRDGDKRTIASGIARCVAHANRSMTLEDSITDPWRKIVVRKAGVLIRRPRERDP